MDRYFWLYQIPLVRSEDRFPGILYQNQAEAYTGLSAVNAGYPGLSKDPEMYPMTEARFGLK